MNNPIESRLSPVTFGISELSQAATCNAACRCSGGHPATIKTALACGYVSCSLSIDNKELNNKNDSTMLYIAHLLIAQDNSYCSSVNYMRIGRIIRKGLNYTFPPISAIKQGYTFAL